MPEPLPSEGFNLLDEFSMEHFAWVMRVWVIVLGLILVQVIVLFIASCVSVGHFAANQKHDANSQPNDPRSRRSPMTRGDSPALKHHDFPEALEL